jgi:hypothetical protein
MVGSEELPPQGGLAVTTVNNNRFDPSSLFGTQVGRTGAGFSLPADSTSDQPAVIAKPVVAPQAPIVGAAVKSLPPLVGGRPSTPFGNSVIGSPVAGGAGIVAKKTSSAEVAPKNYVEYAAKNSEEISAFLNAPSEIKV